MSSMRRVFASLLSVQFDNPPVVSNRKAIRRLLTNRENESATMLRTGLRLCMSVELCQAACTVKVAKLSGRHNKRVRQYPRCVSRRPATIERILKKSSKKSNRDR